MKMYLSSIDAVRAIAALIVAFDHGLLPRQLPIPFDQQLLYVLKVALSGPAAVLVFFVVSGFCIHYPNINRDLSAREFLLRRVVRLGVPFAVASGIAYFLEYRWFEMAFGGPAIWSLACEAIYYLLYIFLHRKLKSMRVWGGWF
ncbi:acyltransferase family protein [Roseateles sp. LKC17W]|uniref:Acyltransferase family protein n=1 Tax=Pelomonas margarita TaxID=3299031 RepID=A0ABW7FQ76_9BURK